jgi:hypothetical protein
MLPRGLFSKLLIEYSLVSEIKVLLSIGWKQYLVGWSVEVLAATNVFHATQLHFRK